MTKIRSKRIEWIDIAKAFSIFLMIIGHVFLVGSNVRNIIFSFHMPLFLILSGYTFHFRRTSKDEWKKATVKDIKRLYVPVLIVWMIDIILNLYLYHNLGYIRDRAYALLWASGYEDTVPYLGMCWFLVSLFWARVIIRTMLCFLDKEQTITLCLAAGILLSVKLIPQHLPQNLDVTFMVMMFLAIGSLWKDNEQLIQKHKFSILLISAVIWAFCLSNGWYIELAVRNYPYGMLCVLESVCGTFICCSVAEAFAGTHNLKKPFLYVGRNTLSLLCVHALDGYFDFAWNIFSSKALTSLLRIAVDVSIWLVIMLLKACLKRNIIRLSQYK